MLIGLMDRTAGLSGRGVHALLPDSDAGDGNKSFAVLVGEIGEKKPGYFLPTFVKSERFGRMASG
jgi:hypothetical protein